MSRRVTLDSPDMRARLRAPTVQRRPVSYQPRPQMSPRPVQDIAVPRPATVKPRVVPAASPQAAARPARRKTVGVLKQQRSRVLMRSALKAPRRRVARKSRARLNQTTVLLTMAAIVFVVGIAASLAGFRANKLAAMAEKLSNQTADAASATAGDESLKPGSGGDQSAADHPSTTPVAKKAVTAYQVAPDLARYIKIPKLAVTARVLQVGVTSSGALGVPGNVFDTAWYTGSAKPGQPGATLIDGHVSSWTTHGVFYDIKSLVPGDAILLQKGDGTTLTYRVRKVTAYPVDNVDMGSLMQPVEAGKSGLNLITCGGKYDSKQGEFTERIAVYASLQ